MLLKKIDDLNNQVEKIDSPIGDENKFTVKPTPKLPLVEKIDSPIGDENIFVQTR